MNSRQEFFREKLNEMILKDEKELDPAQRIARKMMYHLGADLSEADMILLVSKSYELQYESEHNGEAKAKEEYLARDNEQEVVVEKMYDIIQNQKGKIEAMEKDMDDMLKEMFKMEAEMNEMKENEKEKPEGTIDGRISIKM